VSYIPEIAWNDTAIRGELSASGGGFSTFFPRPVWQSAPGVPAINARLVPDVALSASPQHVPYFVVVSGSPAEFGGTSASTPVFAGIVLLLAQALGGSGLGNINPATYYAASVPANVCNTNAVTATCVIHDVTVGNNIVPCVAGTTGCINGLMGYTATVGYDPVTGLGSIDAANLVHAALTQTLGPIISSVVTADGGPVVAQNTFIVIKGADLVPATTPAGGVIWNNAPSFASGLMPTELNGVSVTVNSKPAFVYFYCSAATDQSCSQDQLNILTPLDNTTGPVPIVVTSVMSGKYV
jgi:subtilase family serine protease